MKSSIKIKPWKDEEGKQFYDLNIYREEGDLKDNTSSRSSKTDVLTEGEFIELIDQVKNLHIKVPKFVGYEIDEMTFEYAIGRKPREEELERYVILIKKGMDAQIDWDILNEEAKKIIEEEYLK